MAKMTRRSWLAGSLAMALTSRRLWALHKQLGGIMVFVGTYTNAGSRGIYAYHWLPDTGELRAAGLAAETPNPSYLALAPDGKMLYAVHEMDPQPGQQTGRVSAFALAQEPGKLILRNTVASGGTAPCNVCVDATGRVLFVANYTSGSVATFPIRADGNLSDAVEDIFFPGHGVNPERQQSAHTHCVTVSPDNRFLLVNDLGLDRILVYRFDASTARLTPNAPPFYSAIPGSGPRNFKFHPNRKWAYSLNEMGSSIDVLHWDAVHGTLQRVQNISTLPQEFSGTNTAATVLVHPNGRFVYASNRGHNSIAVYTVDAQEGQLTEVQTLSCGGKTPRFMTLDPSGRWLLFPLPVTRTAEG
jgi:6-phosphogluconolactonase